MERIIQLPHGILLVTGPTGSGKTTTLYAALDKINSPGKKIITIEDPVEYQLNGVNQIQVKPKIGLTFAAGLRHIVRQDPDVIMVGEIRDLETAEIAIQAALTGHLVFSTLHTNDAPGAITRLHDMGVEPYLVASVLEGVLAQRLVRRICASCRKPYEPDPKELQALGIDRVPATARLSRGAGCDECRGTGYRGRTGIYEFMPMTEELRSLILRKRPAHEIRQHAVAAGMTTLRLDGWQQALPGRHDGGGGPPRDPGRHGGACPSSPTGPPTGAARRSTASWRPTTRAPSSSASTASDFFPLRVEPASEKRPVRPAGCSGLRGVPAQRDPGLHPAARHAVRGRPAARPRPGHPEDLAANRAPPRGSCTT